MITELIFEHTVPAGIIRLGLALALITALYSFWRYLPRAFSIFMMAGLRVAFIAALGWTLFFPTERKRESEQTKPRFLVIADTSASMGMSPRPDIPRRWEVVQQALKQQWVAELGGKAEIEAYAFDTGVSSKLAIKELTDRPIKGEGTKLRDALKNILDRYQGQSLAGVLLLSDGLDTSEVGNKWAAGQWAAPIFTLQLEPPDSWEETPDAKVVSVETPRRVAVGWQSEITAVIGATGSKGVPFKVQLFANDELVQETSVQIPTGGGNKEIKFQLDHKVVGNFTYKVKIPALPKETVLENNEFAVNVDVIHAKNRVLYVEGVPRFEFKFLKRALEANKEVSSMIMLQGADGKMMVVGANTDTAATLSREQLSQYVIAIVGDIDAATLGEERAKALVQFVDDGGSLVLLGGDGAWSPAKGFNTTALKELMPVEIDPKGAQEQRLPVALTQDGQNHPALKSLSAKWTKAMHILSIFPVSSISKGASTVVNAGDQPLVVLQRFGQGKVVTILSNSLWRWQMEPGQKDEYMAFWDGLLQWLIPKAEQGSESALDLTADLEQLYMGDTITLTARLGSSRAETGVEPGTVPRIDLQLPDGRKKPIQMQAQATSDGAKPGTVFSATYKVDAAGMHSAIAAAVLKGDRKVESAPFSFIVKPFTPETSPRPQNFEGLKAISQASNGKFCTLEQLNEALRNLEVKVDEQEKLIYNNLYDSPWLLAALMMFLGIEWIWRKTKQMA